MASEACSGSLTSMTDLGDVAEHFAIVLFLQRQAAEILALHLADQHHHRRRVVVGRVQRHHGVGQARAAGDDADAGAVAQPAVGDGHEAGPALMPADDHADGVAFGQHAGQADVAFAGDAEDLVDVVGFQTVRQQAGDGGGHLGAFSRSRCREHRLAAGDQSGASCYRPAHAAKIYQR